MHKAFSFDYLSHQTILYQRFTRCSETHIYSLASLQGGIIICRVLQMILVSFQFCFTCLQISRITNRHRSGFHRFNGFSLIRTNRAIISSLLNAMSVGCINVVHQRHVKLSVNYKLPQRLSLDQCTEGVWSSLTLGLYAQPCDRSQCVKNATAALLIAAIGQ